MIEHQKNTFKKTKCISYLQGGQLSKILGSYFSLSALHFYCDITWGFFSFSFVFAMIDGKMPTLPSNIYIHVGQSPHSPLKAPLQNDTDPLIKVSVLLFKHGKIHLTTLLSNPHQLYCVSCPLRYHSRVLGKWNRNPDTLCKLSFSDHSSHFTKLLSEVSWVETEDGEESASISVTQ